MKLHYLKSLSAVALAGMFAANAYAETLSEVYKVDFTEKEVGYKLYSYYGTAPNDNMQVVATDEGNLLLINGQTVNEDGAMVNDAGLPAWSTSARIPGFTLPSGYNFSHIQMIEVVYKPTQEDGLKFQIELQNKTNPLLSEDEVVVNEWNDLYYFPSSFTAKDTEDTYEGVDTSFDFCMGVFNSSNYYIKSVTFYLEKEVTQREKDEAALDKATAPCFEINFDNWDLSCDEEGNFISCPYLGSLRMSINRPDMIIDKDPENAENKCAHVIYQGWTTIWVNEPIIVPEGYTFDDLRLIEYDIYESDIPGIDYTKPDESNGTRNGSPIISIRDIYDWGWWAPLGDTGCSAGNGRLSEVNEWKHVEFRPSAFAWQEREFEQTKLDENGDPVMDEDTNEPVKETVHWTAEESCKEFGKRTSFYMNIGFFPCNAQIFVDNIKCWFQKGIPEEGEDNAVDSISAAKANSVIYNVYGQPVDASYRGIVIKDGKKYIQK